MLSRLEEFGDIVRYYEGTGHLSEEDGKNSVECQFVAAQYAKGDIRAIFQNDTMFAIRSSSIKFQGKTTNNLPININGPVIVEYNHHTVSRTETEYHSHYQIEIILNNNARMTCGILELTNTEFQFGIVNFEFLGTQSIQIDEKTNSLARLDLNVDGVEVYIDRLYDYKNIMKHLKASRQYAITSTMYISANQCGFEKAKILADQICNLLTIARGRRINWIYIDTVDQNSKVNYTEHRNAITSPFTGIELIDQRPPEITKNFVEECYSICANPIFQSEINKIANSTPDIRSKGNIEGRCLLICSLLDSFYQLTDPNPSNKISTKERITLICKAYNVPISTTEIETYKNQRNNLVHELKLNNPQADYSSILHFFDRILLRILGYTGYYINATKLPVASGAKEDKLVP